MTKPIHLMLVEDHADYRASIALAIKKETDLELVSQFATAEEALHNLQNQSSIKVPNLILLDLNLPGMSGIEAIPHFAQVLPDVKILVLTQSNQEADVLAAISTGAAGYLLKGIKCAELFDGIRSIMNGGALIDPDVAAYLLNMVQTRVHKSPSTKILTDREIDILELVAEGLAQKQIADRLHISIHTVIDHLKHIYEKLNVPNAPAAVAKAFRSGIFPPQI